MTEKFTDQLADKGKLETAQAATPPFIGSSDVRQIVKLTQAAYDGLDAPDDTILYVIVG